MSARTNSKMFKVLLVVLVGTVAAVLARPGIECDSECLLRLQERISEDARLKVEALREFKEDTLRQEEQKRILEEKIFIDAKTRSYPILKTSVIDTIGVGKPLVRTIGEIGSIDAVKNFGDFRSAALVKSATPITTKSTDSIVVESAEEKIPVGIRFDNTAVPVVQTETRGISPLTPTVVYRSGVAPSTYVNYINYALPGTFLPQATLPILKTVPYTGISYITK